MKYHDYLGLGETLLIVDDERVILKTTQAVLTDLNYRVLTVQTGSEALKLLESRGEAIDLVVTDADMRGFDGIALSVMLREREPSTKVIVLTGSPLKERVTDILSKRQIEFVQIPTEIDAFAATLRRVLEKTAQ